MRRGREERSHGDRYKRKSSLHLRAGSGREGRVRRGRYVDALRPLQFQAKPILRDHYFRAKAEAARSLSGDAMKKRVRRLTQEMSRLAAALPLDWNSSVFCTVDEERMDVLR